MINPDENPDLFRLELIRRLKNWRRDGSWHPLFRTYWRLVFIVARSSGLTAEQALANTESVLIETAALLADSQAKPVIGSFNIWLSELVESHILRARCDSRTRKSSEEERHSATSTSPLVLESRTAFQEWFQECWNREWNSNLHRVALENLRRRVNPLSFQIFDLTHNHGWSVDQISKHFGMDRENIEQGFNLVSEAVHREISRLEEEVV